MGFHAYIKLIFFYLIAMETTKWHVIFTALDLIRVTSSKHAKLTH